jgi:hypothetical protein
VQRDIVALERLNQQLHELCAIRLVSENLLPGIAPASQMVKGSFKFNP